MPMTHTLTRFGAVDSIRFKINAGLNKEGNMVSKNITISNISAELTDADFYEVAQAILTLMKVTVMEIHRVTNAQVDYVDMY